MIEQSLSESETKLKNSWESIFKRVEAFWQNPPELIPCIDLSDNSQYAITPAHLYTDLKEEDKHPVHEDALLDSAPELSDESECDESECDEVNIDAEAKSRTEIERVVERILRQKMENLRIDTTTDFKPLTIHANAQLKEQSRLEMIHMLQKTAQIHGWSLARQGGGKNVNCHYFYLKCTRNGEYRDRNPGSVKKRKRAPSKKCNCPFVIQVQYQYLQSLWTFEVVNGVHNHLPEY